MKFYPRASANRSDDAYDPPDHALVDRVRRGDVDALELLIDRYDTRLRDFAFLTIGDADLAAEAAQDVFVSVWNRREVLVIAGRVDDYLYRAVRNRALDMVRSEQARGRLRETLQRQFVVDVESERADSALASEELASVIQAAIDSLTPRVREVFLLSRVHGMPNEAIAAALDLSVPTVKSQLSRAAKHVAEHLARHR